MCNHCNSDNWTQEEVNYHRSSERRQEELLQELYELNQEYKVMCDMDSNYDIDEMREVERRLKTVERELEDMRF